MADGPGLAALAVWPVQVAAGPMRVTIPATPAYRWITVLLERDLLGVVPGMVADDALLDAVADGTVTVAQCRAAARNAIEAASGHRWWTADRLVYLSTGFPWIAGELVLSGVDASRVSLGGWCAAVWRIVTRDREKKDLARIEWELTKPPPGLPVENLHDPQRAAAAFDDVDVPDEAPVPG
jgi:hypothetical protein